MYEERISYLCYLIKELYNRQTNDAEAFAIPCNNLFLAIYGHSEKPLFSIFVLPVSTFVLLCRAHKIRIRVGRITRAFTLPSRERSDFFLPDYHMCTFIRVNRSPVVPRSFFDRQVQGGLLAIPSPR